ncbi:hypothetical protein L9F63_015957 [Diploptera punctata]|uniref:mRNA export factor GLE1 n=1 Tax=Diploptera punctata TaxID=6984 RepID=A0AAD8A4L8_DIPPU|nr:hypothetical protein L9F63_015957 [Diploptera punctata]
MDDITRGLDNLQISVLVKAAAIGKNVTNVTIGPNSSSIKHNDSNIINDNNYAEKIKSFKGKNVYKFNIIEDNSVNSQSRSDECLVLDNSSRSKLKLISEMEEERKMTVRNTIKERMIKMEENSKRCWLELNRKHQFQHRQNLAKLIQEEEMILRQQREEEILASQRQQQYAQEHRQHAQNLQTRSRSIVRKYKRADYLGKNLYSEEQKQRMELTSTSRNLQLRGEVLTSNSLSKVGDVTNLDSQASALIIQQAEEIFKLIQGVCETFHGYSMKSVHAIIIVEIRKLPDETSSYTTKITEVVLSLRILVKLQDFVDKDSFHKYENLKQHLQTFESSCNMLMTDDKLKQFRFNCQKAVNIPLNAISPTSAAHLQDKLIKLSRLISGQPVEAGQTRISASSHPQGIAFCKNLMAKKFVLQGELTVSSKPEAAFAIAAVIEALWADFPDLGQLILAHFHRECPYLVPMFMPQVEGQSNEDYYKSLGYHYNENGEVEKQDKFLKRMSGIMRLYAAILITRPCKYQQNKTNPHGLSHAWHWLSCILNIDPRPDICATLIYDFLEVAGNSMYAHYGQQFQKLLHLICKEYFPKIEKVTSSVSGGPMIRLEAFLQKILKQGHIPPPIGVLPPNFW